MGVDISDRTDYRKRGRRRCHSDDVYIQLLYKLYMFLERRAPNSSKNFAHIIKKRLMTPRAIRYPMSLGRITRKLPADAENKLIVVVGKVLADVRRMEYPKLRIAALKFSDTAREQITQAGGECFTLDQLAVLAPYGKNTFLMTAPKRRLALKHFGPAPGVPGSHTMPYTRDRKTEKARGRRHSRGYKKRA